MEETLFKLARAITDTGTDTVSSEGGTITYRITSLKRKLVNGKVVSTSTPSCTLGSGSVSWATWGGVTVGEGYLDVKINYSENTGSSRSTTLTFTQNGSNNKINLKTLYIMENKVLKLGGGRSTQDVSAEIKNGNSERWTIQSQKRKYVNGKLSGVIEVGYSASINNPDYLLEEDKSNNIIQITAQNNGTSGLCVLTQNESGNKINLHLTTPEEWKIRFNPRTINGVDTGFFFKVTTNISGEGGSMADNRNNKDWIVNQNRYAINVYIANLYPGNIEMLSWSCLDKYGSAFSPNYDLPSNSYFTTKTTGLGSYTLTKVSTPPVSNDTPILSSRFNPTKKYPLDLNFYWADPVLR